MYLLIYLDLNLFFAFNFTCFFLLSFLSLDLLIFLRLHFSFINLEVIQPISILLLFILKFSPWLLAYQSLLSINTFNLFHDIYLTPDFYSFVIMYFNYILNLNKILFYIVNVHLQLSKYLPFCFSLAFLTFCLE